MKIASYSSARKLVKKFKGPLAVIYACPFCSYAETAKTGLRGVGRGYGLSIGGALHSKVSAHIFSQHPDKLV